MAMEYRHLGRTGLKVSVLSFGAWVTFHNQNDVKACKELMSQCREAGVNFFDNAEVYAEGRAEAIMGQAIKELEWKRSDLVLSTKLFWGGPGVNDRGLSRKHIVEGLKASLGRMQTEYVDMLFCHRPDPATPVEETVRAMNWAIDHGYAFYWGTSEWSGAQIAEAWEVARRLDLIGPAMEQPEYNMFERHKVEKEYMPLYDAYGLGLTTWSPLASGVLTGKYSGGNVPEGSRLGMEMYKNMATKKLVQDKLDKVDKLKPIAERLGGSTAQLALAWAARNPRVSTVITGATKPEQVKDNMGALQLLPKLDQSVMDEIDGILGTKPDPIERYGR